MYSMTGFAQHQAQTLLSLLDIEIRAYNNRYTEISIHLPSSLAHLEQWTREQLSQNIARGKISFSCKLNLTSETPWALHSQKSQAFSTLLSTLQTQSLQPSYGFADLKHYQVFEEQADPDLEATYQRTVAQVLQKFQDSRAQEGLKLKEDIDHQLAQLQHLIEQIQTLAPQVDLAYTQKIQEQFAQLTQNQASEQRILEEIAAYLIKVNIHEEMARLKIHIQAMAAVCAEQTNCGRKLDFLCQEIQREITTLSNKTPEVKLQLLAVDFKSHLEKIREQARNVE